MVGGLLMFQLWGLSSAARNDSLQEGKRQAPLPPHAQWIGLGAAAHVDRSPRELSTRRRQRSGPNGAPTLPRWNRRTAALTISLPTEIVPNFRPLLAHPPHGNIHRILS